jgi:hypothetical protein
MKSTTTHASIPAQAQLLRLPHRATAAELHVINLIAQHDPEPNPQLTRRSDAGFAEAFLWQLPTVKASQRGITTRRMHRGLTPQKAQERIALLAQPTESLPGTARVFAGDHPHVTRQRFTVHKSRRLAQKHLGRGRRDDGMAQ